MQTLSVNMPEQKNIVQPEEISRPLVAWYKTNRRTLPWHGADAYGVWISEIMLQQTQAVVVVEYYKRFMQRFPTLQSLASAPLEEALGYWAGLGYYSRLHNIHRAARQIVAEYGGVMPANPAVLRTLPGVGRYTAGAILSIAFGQREPLVDVNVMRVVCRLFALQGSASRSALTSKVWKLAEWMLPDRETGEFNQGLMELGALICLPAEPQCARCPLQQVCSAFRSSDPAAFPDPSASKRTLQVNHSAAIIEGSPNAFWMVRRPNLGLWAGLWEFPRVVCKSGETPEDGALRAAEEVIGCKVDVGQRVALIRHSVTHYRIALHGISCRINSTAPLVVQTGMTAECIPISMMDRYPCAAPQKRLQTALIKSLQTRAGQTALMLELLTPQEAQ